MKRVVAAALTALALAAAGCGSDDGAKSTLDDALGYLPEDSRVLVAIETDPEGEQIQQLDELIERFAFADRVKQGIEDEVEETGSGVDFEDDVRPLLGNELVVGFKEEVEGSDTPVTFAWKAGDRDKAKKLLEDQQDKTGEIDGADVYELDDGEFAALDGDVIVGAPTRPMLEQAIERRDGDGRLTEDDFEDRLGPLDRDAVIRVAGDIQRLLEQEEDSATARQVPWVGALRSFSAIGFAKGDGIGFEVDVKTAGVRADQLPLAAGSPAPPVVKRPGELGLAVRDPGRIFDFAREVAETSGDDEDEDSLREALDDIGVDLERDILDQLGDESASSFPLDDSFVVRVDLKDPEAFEKTLRTLADALPAPRGPASELELDLEPGGGGFYRASTPSRSQFFVGVVGERLAIGSDAERAREFAEADAAPVPGTRGAVALTADLKGIVDRVIAREAEGAAAIFGRAFTAPLKDLTAWFEARPDGLTGHVELTVR